MSLRTPSPNSQSSQSLPRELGVIVLSMVVVYCAAQFFQNRSNYNKGHEAYRRIDCSAATPYFDRVINSWQIADFGGFTTRAQQEKSECLDFKSALTQEQSGNLGQAIVTYNKLINNPNQDSNLANSVRDRLKSLFAKNQPTQLATQEFCDDLKQFHPNIIPERDAKLPSLYLACAEKYTSLKNYNKATVMYESFLDEYPTHSLASQVKTSWAKVLVAQAKAEGAGTLPAPQRTSSNGGGLPSVTIRNESPEPMRIVFSGPDARIEELPKCDTCQKYVGQGPESCPNQGPVGRYTLKPGEYDVVVKSTGDKLVRPFKGNWTMNSGWKYSNCFYIVTNPNPVEEKSNQSHP